MQWSFRVRRVASHLTIWAVMFLGSGGRDFAPAVGHPASELWEKAITAKGGRQRLHDIQSFAIGTAVPNTHASPVAAGERSEFVSVLPDKFWRFVDYRPGSMGFSTEVWNGEKGDYWSATGPRTAV